MKANDGINVWVFIPLDGDDVARFSSYRASVQQTIKNALGYYEDMVSCRNINKSDLLIKMVPPDRSTQFFDFLGLPRELRDEIYQGLLPGRVSHQDQSPRTRSVPAMLLVNRQIREEFQDTLFRKTTYVLRFETCDNRKCPCHRFRPPSPIGRMTEVMQRPEAHKILHIHKHQFPVKLASKHEDYMKLFRHIEINFKTLPSHRSEGCNNISQIVQSVSKTLKDLVDRSRPMLTITVRWFYKASTKTVHKSDNAHLARLDWWVRAIKSHNLIVLVGRKILKRVDRSFELLAELHVAPQWYFEE